MITQGWARARTKLDEVLRAYGYVKMGPDKEFRGRRGPGARISNKRFRRMARARGYTRELSLESVINAQRFAVDEVIDVGVHAGTDWLYRAFGESRFVLVEPIPDGEELLTCRPDSYVYVNCGLGASPGQLTLNRYNNEKLDSFLDLHHLVDEVRHPRQRTERVVVPVRTLDDIIETYCTSDNIGIKIDTEGFELEVIRGLDKHKERVTFIVAESSVVRRHINSYQFSDLVAELREKGFYFLNVMNPLRRSAKFYDTIFVQGEDPRLDAVVNRIDDLSERDREARRRVLSRGRSCNG